MQAELAKTDKADVQRPAIYHARMSRKDPAGKPPSQTSFAAEIGIHPITLARLELYGRMVPGKRLAQKIAEVLSRTTGIDVTPGEVIDEYQKHVGGAE